MKLTATATAIALFLGLSIPTIAIGSIEPAVAMPVDFSTRPTGAFKDLQTNSTWLVKLSTDEFGAYTYLGQRLGSSDDLELKNAVVGGTDVRPTYTFSNGDYRYIVAHQIADPDYIRLTVMDPSGQEILNELMKFVGNDWDV